MAGMPSAPWRDAMLAASFRGAAFRVETDGQAGGRRTAVHEFPERDVPFTEDLGRRARRWQVAGYIVCGPLLADYRPARDTLVAACEAYGPGTLVHPTLGSVQACCDSYAVTETRERGGFVAFEMIFVEAGSIDGNEAATPDTRAASTAAAKTLSAAAANRLDAVTQASLAATGGTVAA